MVDVQQPRSSVIEPSTGSNELQAPFTGETYWDTDRREQATLGLPGDDYLEE